jgi:hypothetical protein
MKNEKKAVSSKLATRIDMELKALLLADLKAYQAKYPSIRKAGLDYSTAA